MPEKASAGTGSAAVLPQRGGSLADVPAVEAWAHARLDPGLIVTDVTGPTDAGYSARTLIVTLAGADRGSTRLVLKVAGRECLLPDMQLAREYAVVEALQSTSVPVAPLRGFEPDPAWLGAPFIAMDFVPGESPTDVPLYHKKGWLVDASPSERAQVWRDGLRAMTAVHAVHPRWLQLHEQLPDVARASVAWHVERCARDLEWICAGGPQPATAAKALRWVRERAGDDKPSERRLLWGDARMGNIVFRDFSCRALLDWEMASVGQPEQDLGWWLFHDRHHSEGYGVPRLAGLPHRDETIACYADLLGRALADVRFFEVLAGLRLALVTARVVILQAGAESQAGTRDPWKGNAALRVLEALLDLED